MPRILRCCEGEANTGRALRRTTRPGAVDIVARYCRLRRYTYSLKSVGNDNLKNITISTYENQLPCLASQKLGNGQNNLNEFILSVSVGPDDLDSKLEPIGRAVVCGRQKSDLRDTKKILDRIKLKKIYLYRETILSKI